MMVAWFSSRLTRGPVKVTKHVEDNDVLDYKGESKGLQNWFSLSMKLWNSLENSHRLWNTERIWKTQQDTKRPWHVMTDHFSLINLESLWSLSNSFTNACWRLVLSSCCWSLKQTYPPAAAQPLHAQQTPAEQQSRSAPRWPPAAPRSAPRWAQPATTLPPPPTSQLSTGRPVLVCLWGHRRHLVNIHFWPNFDPLIQQKLPCL